jgi:hypothetical protein
MYMWSKQHVGFITCVRSDILCFSLGIDTVRITLVEKVGKFLWNCPFLVS